MSDPPAVSVIIPARDAGATLGAALASLASQTLTGWEALVVDDGSRDDTRAVAEAAAAGDPRVRVLDGPGEGPGAARNLALAAARAPLVHFLDADDLIEPDALAVLSGPLADPAVDVVHGGWVRLYADGSRGPDEFAPDAPDLFPELAVRCAFAIHAAIARRQALVAAGGFDVSLRTTQDWDLWQRVARRGARFRRVPRVVARLRRQGGSGTRDAAGALADAVAIIARGHDRDPRVADPAPAHAAGRPPEERRAATVLAWAHRAAAAGSAGAADLLAGLVPTPGLRTAPDDLAGAILGGLAVADPAAWRPPVALLADHAATVDALLALAGDATGDVHLEPRVRRRLADRALADPGVATPVRVGGAWCADWDLERPPPAVPPDAQRVVLRIRLGPEALTTVVLPVVVGAVDPATAADALPDAAIWALLERAGAEWDPEACAADPWTWFLRATWGRPEGAPGDFYPRGPADAVDPPPDALEHLDVTDPPPSGTRGARWVQVAVAGVPLARVAVGPGDADAALPVATQESGFELCRAVVREAVLGRPLGEEPRDLRGRLAAARRGRRAWVPTQPTLVIPRRACAPGGPAWRRARLPVAAAGALTGAPGAHVVPAGAPPAAVAYRPDVIGAEGAGEARSAGGADPWTYERPHERRRYEQTLRLIGSEVVGRALAIGCAEGHLTRALAGRARALVVADGSAIALERARARLEAAGHRHVEYRRLDLASDPLPGDQDLIVASGMLHHVGDPGDLAAAIGRVAAALRPGGRLVCIHSYVRADDPAATGYDRGPAPGAPTIGEAIAASPDLALETELRAPLYRIHVARRPRRPPRRRRRPEVIEQEAVRPEGEPAEVAPPAVPILMYHRVADSGAASHRRFRVTPAELDEHLAIIAELGFATVDLRAWARMIGTRTPPGERMLILTFDDAYVDFATDALPLLERHGMTATVFVPTGHVGGTSAWDALSGAAAPIMDWDALGEIVGRGVAVGAHSVSHRPLSALGHAEVVTETARSRAQIEDRLGVAVTTFAYPYGDNDAAVRHLVGAAGIDVAVTVESRASALGDDPLGLPRIEVDGHGTSADLIAALTRQRWRLR